MKFRHSIIFKRHISFLLIVLLLFQTVGCSYYKVHHVSSDFGPTIKDIGRLNKYFIIHDGDETYSMTELSVDSTYLYGDIGFARDSFFYSDDRELRFRTPEDNILNEVHFYLDSSATNIDWTTTQIPLADIHEIRIIDRDNGKTTASFIGTSLGITAGVVAIIAIIVALTKSSCPYIYVHDGEGFVFEGETFGGAIAQNLERDDYMPLPSIQPEHGIYRIRVSNELKERQYIDVAKLLLVNHDKNQSVLLDKYGNPQLIEQLQGPTTATAIDGTNISSLLESKDRKVYLFDNPDYTKNNTVLKFNKPTDTKKGKLVLNTKNTLWFDYVFGEFLKKFGIAYDDWMAKQAKLPTEERLRNIKKYGFPLSVYIKKNNDWQLVDFIHTIGPLANRDMVIPMDLNDIGADQIEIKIETGFMFWELDYAAMDFTPEMNMDVIALKPTSAIGTGALDWTSTLQTIDADYMAQEQVGDIAELTYEIPPALQHKHQSVFLHTRGYYELIRKFEGPPKFATLNKFKEPDYFSQYSRDGFLRTMDMDETYIAKLNSDEHAHH